MKICWQIFKNLTSTNNRNNRTSSRYSLNSSDAIEAPAQSETENDSHVFASTARDFKMVFLNWLKVCQCKNRKLLLHRMQKCRFHSLVD